MKRISRFISASVMAGLLVSFVPVLAQQQPTAQEKRLQQNMNQLMQLNQQLQNLMAQGEQCVGPQCTNAQKKSVASRILSVVKQIVKVGAIVAALMAVAFIFSPRLEFKMRRHIGSPKERLDAYIVDTAAQSGEIEVPWVAIP